MYPTLFTIPYLDLPVSTFGVMVAVGFLVGGRLAERYFEEGGLDAELAWRVVVYCMVGGILGSKLWFAAEQVLRGESGSFLYYAFGSRAGMTFYGGLAGGIVAAAIVIRYSGLPVAAVFNAGGPTLAIGQGLGRVGCLLVGDDYGRATESWVGIAFPDGLPPTPVPVHPTQIYEAVWLALGAAWLWRRRSRSPFLFGEYLLIQGLGRLWIEVFRINPAALGPLTQAQLIALACIALGIAGWIYVRARPGLQFKTRRPS